MLKPKLNLSSSLNLNPKKGECHKISDFWFLPSNIFFKSQKVLYQSKTPLWMRQVGVHPMYSTTPLFVLLLGFTLFWEFILNINGVTLIA